MDLKPDEGRIQRKDAKRQRREEEIFLGKGRQRILTADGLT